MNNVLHDQVLVLNRNWQAIDITNVETAFCNLVRNVHTGIDTTNLRTVTFEEWMALPIREGDKTIGTTHGLIRVPTVIACVHYDRMPKKAPKLNSDNIRKRDDNRCQYTNRKLGPGEGNLDHVLPLSRGGKNTWENLVWSARDVNQEKANRLPEEAGMKLLRKPKAPGTIPAMLLIESRPDKPDWDHFLVK